VAERHSHSGLTASGNAVERVLGARGAQARVVEHSSAEEKRRLRAGLRSQGGPGSAALIWQAPPRNGLPFRPYVYRGLGYDQYEHLYEEETAC
jgi:hypothetical protein